MQTQSGADPGFVVISITILVAAITLVIVEGVALLLQHF